MKSEPRGLLRLLPGRPSHRPVVEPGFLLEGGRLSVDGPEIFDQDPVNLLRLFRIADARDLDLHPDAFTAVTRRLGLITSKVRRDPAAARVFLDILARGKKTRRTLELMNEAGVLGRYIPEFGHIVAQMQFNMYHSYTVDEHTLRAVGIINDIAAGRFADDHPLATTVMPLIEDREALFLAMLLHDTGKGGVGGQEKAGARAARQACERLGLERHRIELVAWLVEHHLMMSDYAQKRDVSDSATVAAFAAVVQNPERLRLLLVLTVADIRAVGPGRLERLEGPASARALRRYRDGVSRRPRIRRGRHCKASTASLGLRGAYDLGHIRSDGAILGERHGRRLLRGVFEQGASDTRCPRQGSAREGRGRGAREHPPGSQRGRNRRRRPGSHGAFRGPCPGDIIRRRQRGGRANLHVHQWRGP